jgi:hypothetical protein
MVDGCSYSLRQERKMLRHAIVASAALAIISGTAVANPFHSRTTVHKTAHGMVETKQHKSLFGKLVTKRKVTENRMSGSAVSRSKTVTDPATGASKTNTTTKTTNGE